MNRNSYKAKIEEIENIIFDYTPGWKNTDAINSINNALTQLSLAIDFPSDAKIVLTSIKDKVSTLYSQRNHAKYGGIQAVSQSIMNDFSRLKMILNRHDNQES